jgi:hypothetical protein
MVVAVEQKRLKLPATIQQKASLNLYSFRSKLFVKVFVPSEGRY